MDKIIQTLRRVNWDFSDYNSTRYPLDINSIPWYPATFPVPIPKYLIALLSQKKECVLDPFGGKGTTIFEAVKQDRKSIYNDINPFAKDVVFNLILSIKSYAQNANFIKDIIQEDNQNLNKLKRIFSIDKYLQEDINNNRHLVEALIDKFNSISNCKISLEAIHWYHIDTLLELCEIYKLIDKGSPEKKSVRKAAFVSILKENCSQRGHFTYVTDNCKPKILKYYDAKFSYLNMLERLCLATEDFIRQFSVLNEDSNILNALEQVKINEGDARDLSWINDQSVDLIITSPPYLCAQDYTKTMRLTNLFYPDSRFNKIASEEIGPRSQRRNNASVVVQNFYDDLKSVFLQIYRILKKEKFFCLVIGQGSGNVTKEFDTIRDLVNILINEIGFSKYFSISRNISHKSIRIGGVNSEEIIILRK